MFHNAICRRPGPDFAGGLTMSNLGAPDFTKALATHVAYVDIMRKLGLEVQVLEALPGHPDACFVEDPAVVVPELAVLTNPGADSRKGEVESIGHALELHRECSAMESPGTLDGGDVLIIDKMVYVGLTNRTNPDGINQLKDYLEPFGYEVEAVAVDAGLHLKSSVNWLGEKNLLLSKKFAKLDVFAGYQKFIVDANEDYACNTLWINGTLIMAAGFPRTRDLIDRLGLPVIELDLSQYQKMDGGLTCLSLRF